MQEFFITLTVTMFVFLIRFIPDYLEHAKIRSFDKYKDLIFKHEITNIDEMANRLGKLRTTVLMDVRQMIDGDYAKNLRFDNTRDNVIVISDELITYSKVKEQNGPQYKICKNCGAKNPADSNICEYCDAPLN